MSENIFVVGANPSLSGILNQASSESAEDIKFFFVNESSSAEVAWNRASPVSARSVFMQGKNLYSEFLKGIVIFNSADFAKFSKFNVESISKAVDSMILGNSYIVTELTNHFAENAKGGLVFILISNGDEKSTLQEMGEATFAALAEGIAKNHACNNCQITLIKTDAETFVSNSNWLFTYLENASSKKIASNPQKACKWIKPGTKPGVLMSFVK